VKLKAFTEEKPQVSRYNALLQLVQLLKLLLFFSEVMWYFNAATFAFQNKRFP
jgi:hypothetical protein